MNPMAPITETDLHAYVDDALIIERRRKVEAWLALHPGEAARVESYREQKRVLRELFDPSLHEAIPERLLRAVAGKRVQHFTYRLVAGVAIALICGGLGWQLRGYRSVEGAARVAASMPSDKAFAFARQAAVAHAVYSPDQRRPVEVDAAHEDQLVAWLSKRMGTAMQVPHLQTLGYALEGGRLLPGESGPAAQFMYRDSVGNKLTLYVTAETKGRTSRVNTQSDIAEGKDAETVFRFAEQDGINVFYWIDGRFGYAISTSADRATLQQVSTAVYHQLQQK